MQSKSIFRTIRAFVMTAALGIAAAQPGAATTYVVNSMLDDDSSGTLRDAIDYAHYDPAPPTIITFNLPLPATITLQPGGNIYTVHIPIQVNKSMTIQGPGADLLTIDSNGLKGFQIGSEAAVVISGMTICNAAGNRGPAVSSAGILTLIDCVLTGNTSSEYGGAVWNAGKMALVNCTLSGNSAPNGGGAICNGDPGANFDVVALSMDKCTLDGNQVTSGSGGAILNLDAMALTDCTLSNNTAIVYGGAIASGDTTLYPTDTSLRVTRCTLKGNSVIETSWPNKFVYGGGAIANLAFPASADLFIEDSTLTGNTAPAGGAVYNLSIRELYPPPAVPGNAETSILRSTLSDNTAVGTASDPAAGGAVFQISLGSLLESGTYATVTVDSCTLNGNTARGSTDSFGGAIGNMALSSGSVVVRNSTLANNAAVFAEDADPAYTQFAVGGAALGLGGTLTVDNCTLSGNRDSEGMDVAFRASGIGVSNGGSVFLKNTILANDASGPNLAIIPASVEDKATMTSLGHNLSTDAGGGFLSAEGDLINTDPLLGPVADNGGPTWTCALLPGSPAIDTADAFDGADSLVQVDQRGVARPNGSANDIGAFELEQTSVLNVSVASIERCGKTVIITALISNSCPDTASNVVVMGATLGDSDTYTALPVVYRTIKTGASKKCTLMFKNVARGEASFRVEGTCSLGSFYSTETVLVK